MSDYMIGLTCLALTAGGALAGNALAYRLPDHHLSTESRQTISVSMAVVGMLTAMVLGLSLSAANNSFADRQDKIVKIGTQVILVHDLLTRYGLEATDARGKLRAFALAKKQQLFPQPASPVTDEIDSIRRLELTQEAILGLKPKDERQRWLQSHAAELTGRIFETRWLLEERPEGNIPNVFVFLVMTWLTLVFFSFGLCAPTNPTALSVIVVGAMAVSLAIMMILELDTPLAGIIQISDRPLRDAITRMGV